MPIFSSSGVAAGTGGSLAGASTTSEGGTLGYFGDGSDGAVTISENTTLTRDMYYSTLVVNNGVSLNAANYRIFASISITNNGTIHNNGNSASAQTGGTPTTVGSFIATNQGANGQMSNGSAATASTNSLGGGGGGGGNGSGTTGGAGGTASIPSASVGGFRFLGDAIRGYAVNGTDATIVQLKGGAGGGGAGGAGAMFGGGGGAGGGILSVCAPTIINTSGTISVNGGAGGTGPADVGGGGGGGGGVLVMVYNKLSSGTETASGGALGTATGGGTNGVAGTAGTVLKYQV